MWQQFRVFFKGESIRLNSFCYNSMKKYEYLESSTKVSQLQARLNMNSYLSKTSLPTGADAKIFLLLEAQKKIPNRQIHPNLYHWYILMKQFSLRTLEIWQQDSVNQTDDDRLIQQFVQLDSTSSLKDLTVPLPSRDRITTLKRIDSNDKAEIATPNKSYKKILNLEAEETSGGPYSRETNLNNSTLKPVQADNWSGPSQRERGGGNPSKVEIQCVMEMQLKAEENTSIREFKQRLADQKLKLVSLQGEQEKIRVVFKTDLDHIQQLKDRISQWQQISNLQFRKQKKLTCKLQMKSEKLLSPQKPLSNFVN